MVYSQSLLRVLRVSVLHFVLLSFVTSLALAAPRSGVVRLDNRAFTDDQGAFPALGASLFWAVWGYQHDRPRLEKNLDLLAASGFDFIRCFAQVGPRHWEDRTIDPNAPGYDEALAGTIDLAYEKGLRTELTIFGGTELTLGPEARAAFVDRVAAILLPRAHKIIFVEVANEYYHDFIFGMGAEEELRSLARRLTGSLPNLVTLSAPPGDDACELYKDSGVALGSIHMSRDLRQAPGQWGPVMQPWSYPFPCFPAAGINNEPIGPGSSVANEDDPTRLIAAAALTWIAGMPAYVYHSHAGVWGGGEHGKGQADLLDHPTAAAIFAGYKNLKGLMPPDLPNWERHDLSSEQHVLQLAPKEQRWLNGDPTGVIDAYAAHSGRQWIILIAGVKDAVQFTARASMKVELYELPEVALKKEWEIESGGGLHLEVDPDPANGKSDAFLLRILSSE